MGVPLTNALLDLIDSLSVLRQLGTVEECRAGQTILVSGAPQVDAYFPITAVMSLVSTMTSGDSCEVELVGHEGMVGLSGVLRAFDSPTSCVVQAGGTYFRVPAHAVRTIRTGDVTVRDVFDRYSAACLIQVTQVAACSRLHPVGPRLSRWLLGLHDRMGRDHLPLSQQSIANSLGVHRPTIALELQRLHSSGAIFYRSRIIRIADRSRLESLACECHGVLHREYLSLLQPLSASELTTDVTQGDHRAAASAMLENNARSPLVAASHEHAGHEGNPRLTTPHPHQGPEGNRDRS